MCTRAAACRACGGQQAWKPNRVTRGTRAQEWLDEAKVTVEGGAYNVSASGDGGEVLVGTAAGFIYRVKLGARGTRPTVLPVCESHASAAASLEEGLGKASALLGCASEIVCMGFVDQSDAHALTPSSLPPAALTHQGPPRPAPRRPPHHEPPRRWAGWQPSRTQAR